MDADTREILRRRREFRERRGRDEVQAEVRETKGDAVDDLAALEQEKKRFAEWQEERAKEKEERDRRYAMILEAANKRSRAKKAAKAASKKAAKAASKKVKA